MYISATLLFLFIGASSAKKQGDFGIFSACLTKNNSLRLECYYATCPNSPLFDCEIKTANESLLANVNSDKCQLVLQGHRTQHADEPKSYNCTLMRNGRREEKNITVDYKIRMGKNRIKPCPATTGLLLHRAPTLLWPVVILSLWKVLVTDSQTV